MPSLSQRYRPHRFADITGQAHITEPLRRSLATNHVAHAFLFSGPRGVGKTTTARILSQALICESLKEGEPCGACPACQAFEAGTLVDVVELDAATHTGVELVREAIIEHARFVPMMGKRKVYILDEAHMLSTSSWNALLKTLEEPPAHAFFILATTEAHKVPATIASRCQRSDFRRIPDQALAERMREIAKQEAWTIDEDVVRLIVSRAEGCLRDAETLLGQLGGLGETHLTLNLAHLIVPPSRLPVAATLFTHWTEGDLAAALRYVRELFDLGIPIGPLFDDLLLAVRLLLVTSALPAQAEAWKDNEYRVFVPLVGRWSASELHDLALSLMDRRRDLRFGVDPVFLLELVSTVASHRLFGRAAGSERVLSQPVRTAPPSVSVKPEIHPVIESAAPIVPTSIPTPDPAPASVILPMMPVSVEPTTEATVISQVSSPITPIATPFVGEPAVGDLTLDTVRAKWNVVISTVDERNHSLPFILKISRPERVDGSLITVRFQYPFHHDKVITDMKHRKIVEEALQVVFGQTLQLAGVVGDEGMEAGQKKSDMVSNILKAFGGAVVE
ncbi:DNA polymerase III subunit gamma/tau [Patescibacteria group bacterium]|nr:DNA polymerase III subunit gamma/tau [Patescibacteria group bacterium]